jgi:glycine hydroxymethyltransferase
MSPGGVRIGTPAITSRGFKEGEIKILAGFFEKAVNIAKAIQETHKPKDVKGFVALFEDEAYKG